MTFAEMIDITGNPGYAPEPSDFSVITNGVSRAINSVDPNDDYSINIEINSGGNYDAFVTYNPVSGNVVADVAHTKILQAFANVNAGHVA